LKELAELSACGKFQVKFLISTVEAGLYLHVKFSLLVFELV